MSRALTRGPRAGDDRRVRTPITLLFAALCACSSSATPDTDAGDAGGAGDAIADASNKDAQPADSGPTDGGTWDGYYAYGRSGSRIFVYKADAQRDLCFAIRLIAAPNLSALALPTGWNVEASGVFRAAAACNPQYMGTADFQPTLSASGSISWQGAGIPLVIDKLDVTLNFAPSMWAPSSETLQGTNLAVK